MLSVALTLALVAAGPAAGARSHSIGKYEATVNLNEELGAQVLKYLSPR